LRAGWVAIIQVSVKSLQYRTSADGCAGWRAWSSRRLRGPSDERDPTPVAVGRHRVHARRPRPQTVLRYGPRKLNLSQFGIIPGFPSNVPHGPGSRNAGPTGERLGWASVSHSVTSQGNDVSAACGRCAAAVFDGARLPLSRRCQWRKGTRREMTVNRRGTRVWCTRPASTFPCICVCSCSSWARGWPSLVGV
jgi:hypothetical protein